MTKLGSQTFYQVPTACVSHVLLRHDTACGKGLFSKGERQPKALMSNINEALISCQARFHINAKAVKSDSAKLTTEHP